MGQVVVLGVAAAAFLAVAVVVFRPLLSRYPAPT